MFKILSKKDGFTLVELLVVIAVIGILASIAIPRFGGFRERAKEAAYISELQLLRQTINFIEIEDLDFNVASLQRYLGNELNVNNNIITYQPGGGERIYILTLQPSSNPNYITATIDDNDSVDITITRNAVTVNWR